MVILLHGLSGCHGSPYVNRAAGKLNDVGHRTFRMDFRGCGAGVGLATRPYHAGLSEDLRHVVEYVERICPESPVSLVGYSLGGNLVLKLLGEQPGDTCRNVVSGVAVCPAVDLPESQVELRRFLPGLYDRYFTRRLVRQFAQFEEHLEPAWAENGRAPRTLREFDETVTARVWGFGTADRYYDSASTADRLVDIAVPTLVIAAEDDPVVPIRSFENLDPGPNVHLMITPSGGHLGFVGRGGPDPDRRWMDWRIVDWIQDHARTSEVPSPLAQLG